ncbi:aminotransferase class V-fold PLP-dependent enzyme, partial [Romboutsia sp. 13368]|uniref:aminotransferase class V-fold PLP-dependent enzyme n=1 Tax=Romboutsia sp. 13368 TaxID=2708053 RepID=UPI0025CE29A0
MDYRDLYDGIDDKIQLPSGKYITPINFDNGATTPPLKSVTKAIQDNIKNYGPIARGVGFKGEYCTSRFNNARDTILEFFGLGDCNTHTVIYTKSDTESLNILANSLIKDKEDMILTTRMEHHANDLPFRRLGRMTYVDVDELGRINIDDIEKELKKANGKIKIVTVTGASNVTGYITPIHEIAKLAHRYGAIIIVDGAQLVAHKEININGNCEEESIDFLTFSAHKAYAPFGSSAIVGLIKDLYSKEPFEKGGGCVDYV